jgi:hypothetical protein
MLEFLLFLPIMLFIGGLAIYLALGIHVKERSWVKVRQEVWNSGGRNQNNNGTDWQPYYTAGRTDGSWSPWDPSATGDIGDGAATSTEAEPRGTGEELDYLFTNAGSNALSATGESLSIDYFHRIWNNLCGRRLATVSGRYTTHSDMFEWMDATIRTQYASDTPTWVHGQLPIWLIAQYGPMAEIKAAFDRHLSTVPPEFDRMASELRHSWFEEHFMTTRNPNN